jgi:hypothetical protein
LNDISIPANPDYTLRGSMRIATPSPGASNFFHYFWSIFCWDVIFFFDKRSISLSSIRNKQWEG